MRLQWLPTWEDLQEAYNVQHIWAPTELNYDRAAADACARFVVACFFGPLHVATSTGEATPDNRRLIRNLTMALRDATKSPGRVTQRGVSITYASGRLGRLWTLKLGSRIHSGFCKLCSTSTKTACVPMLRSCFKC